MWHCHGNFDDVSCAAVEHESPFTRPADYAEPSVGAFWTDLADTAGGRFVCAGRLPARPEEGPSASGGRRSRCGRGWRWQGSPLG